MAKLLKINWQHSKLGSSSYCIFKMKHATALFGTGNFYND